MINSGEISVPKSSDGRYTNVASINVKDKMFQNEEELAVYLSQLEKEFKIVTTESEEARIQRDQIIANALN